MIVVLETSSSMCDVDFIIELDVLFSKCRIAIKSRSVMVN